MRQAIFLGIGAAIGSLGMLLYLRAKWPRIVLEPLGVGLLVGLGRFFVGVLAS